MPAPQRLKQAPYILVLIFIFGAISPAPIFSADVVINEFSPISNPEWVELFNNGSTVQSLNGYTIYFHNSLDTNQKKTFCPGEQMEPQSYRLIEVNRYLNNDGDTVILTNQNNEEVDSIPYGSGQSLSKITDSQSATREPDGGSNWIVTENPTPSGKKISFDCPTPIPTPTLTPSSTPTNTPKPTPTPTPTSLTSQTPEPTEPAIGVVAGASLGTQSSPSTLAADFDIGSIIDATPSSSSAFESTPSSEATASGKLVPLAIAGGSLLLSAAIAPFILKRYNIKLWEKLFQRHSSAGDQSSSGQG